MGIDFSHCEAHWAYSGFHRARCKLAAVIGIDLNYMEGFQSAFGAPTDVEPIKWDSLKKDPIHKLLHHSDCDGHITAKDCRRIAPRIRELVKEWPDDDYDKIQFLMLADGMDAAAAESKPLKFR